MKIGIDVFGCNHGKSGLGSYLANLINHLPHERGVDFELFGEEIDRYTYKMNNDFPYHGISMNDTMRALRFWHLFSANGFVKKKGFNVVLYTAATRMLPVKFDVPGVAVVSDVATSVFSKHDSSTKSRIKRGLSNIDCIIVPSFYVKKNLEHAGVDCKRVEIVHNGIDHSFFFPIETISESDIVDIKPFAIKKPYIIYASRMLGPEKKHVELIKAYSLFKERTGFPHRLVIAGGDVGDYGEDVRKAAYESRYASEIFITGFFPHESFPELYRNCSACIFPASNEGAGLTVLEAMATGVPVACSKSGALFETAGTHALFFDSDDIDEMATCIERIITDEPLREKLIDGGLEWAANFSWEKCAQETFDLLKSVSR